MLWTIVIGLVVGVLAKFIMPGKDPGGIVITILLGIAGSVVVGWLGSLVGFYQPGERAGLLASVLGAALILWIYRRVRKSP